ncbi:MAG: hypothetical protein HRU34_07675 [Richelia sp.]|nr:hypothetical protein [Richelia sp.]
MIGVPESGDDFTKFSTIYQWFQTLIHPALMHATPHDSISSPYPLPLYLSFFIFPWQILSKSILITRKSNV